MAIYERYLGMDCEKAWSCAGKGRQGCQLMNYLKRDRGKDGWLRGKRHSTLIRVIPSSAIRSADTFLTSERMLFGANH
jgi:hypothetical protein